MAISDPASPAVSTGQGRLNQHHKVTVHYQHLITTCTIDAYYDDIMRCINAAVFIVAGLVYLIKLSIIITVTS